ncbi:hypothetical protein ACULNC_26630 [Shigella flexneri]
MNIQALLSEKVRQAMIAAGAPADCEPQIVSHKSSFGDYQANGMMAVAKTGTTRQLAEQVLTHLNLNGIASKVEIAGPGFINISLIGIPGQHVQQALASDRPALLRQKTDHCGRLLCAKRGERDARRSPALYHYW